MAVKFTFQSVFGNSGQNPRHFSAWGREESLGLYSILWCDWPTSKQKILRHGIVLPLGFADAIFGRERSDDRKCVCGSQARIRRCASRPTKFMGKTVTVPHFNSDTVEFASRKRDESNQRIQTLLPFLKKITEESDLENFQDFIVALEACYWLHKTISISLSRFGDDRAI